MTKIVYNACYGGFSLSDTAMQRYAELAGYTDASDRDFNRADPLLVQVVEELGSAANGAHAKLRIAEVPAGSKYRIDEYDGAESVMTPDDYEWETA
jgi:hypothetical protein